MLASDAQRPAGRGLGPTLALFVFAAVMGVGTAFVGPFVLLPLVGVGALGLIVARPEYGIALFLATFLMTYRALQGSGLLTPNNVLGGIFLVLLTYKLYREPDWWFLKCRELQLLGLLFVIYYLSGRLNGPDVTRVALLGLDTATTGGETLRTFAGRAAFVLFFINFIRTPEHVRMVFVLALAFMVISAFTGMHDALSGGGSFHGRAAGTSGVIQSAVNPNRLAMFAILAMVGLWYLMQAMRFPLFRLAIIPTMMGLSLTVLLTASRSGLLGLGVAMGAIVIDQRISIATLLNFAMAGLLVVFFLLPFVPEKTLDRITNLPGTHAGETGEGSGSLERRQYTWEIAAEMIEQSPLLGVGLGNWDVVRFFKDPTHSTAAPHSSYILAFVEGGVFCLFGYLTLLWRTWQNVREAERFVVDPAFPLTDLTWVVKSCKVSLLVLVFFSLVADLWEMIFIFLLIALGVVLRRLVEQTALQEALA